MVRVPALLRASEPPVMTMDVTTLPAMVLVPLWHCSVPAPMTLEAASRVAVVV